MKKILFSLFAIICLATSGFSQDVLVLKNKSQIKGKIVAVNNSEISYVTDYTALQKIAINEVSQLILFNTKGKFRLLNTYQRKKSSTIQLVENSKSIFKINLLAPIIGGHTSFSYERVLKPRLSIEATVGIIGAGRSVNDNFLGSKSAGYFLKLGPKLVIGRNKLKFNNITYSHALKGFYLKPEVIYTNFSRHYSGIDTSSWDNCGGILLDAGGPVKYTNRYSALALTLTFGKQYIIANKISFSYYLGAGISIEKFKNGANETLDIVDHLNLQRYSYLYSKEHFRIPITGGFTVGYLF